MNRLIGLLCWFDEPLPALVRCLTSLRERMGVDHVVALDGRYSLFPGHASTSDPRQAKVIALTCSRLGMTWGCYEPPNGPWPGEPEKRTALFGLGLEAANPGDWFVVMDADQAVTKAPADLKQRLAATDLAGADVTFHDDTLAQTGGIDWFPTDFPMRIMFRAQEIRVVDHHANYLAADDSVLWFARDVDRQVPGLDLTGEVTIKHMPGQRPLPRQLNKQTYYAVRDGEGIEFGACVAGCGRPAVIKLHGRWRRARGTDKLVGQILELCEPCAKVQRRRDDKRIRSMGFDPNGRTSEHYGQAPR